MVKLVGFLAVLSGLFAGATVSEAAENAVLDAPSAYQDQQKGDLTIIDIRRPEEWRATGIPDGALAITMHDPSGPGGFLVNVLKALKGNKAQPIGLICATGSRSAWAQAFLQANGFTEVYNIRDGMMGRGRVKGWIREGLPVAPPPSP